MRKSPFLLTLLFVAFVLTDLSAAQGPVQLAAGPQGTQPQAAGTQGQPQQPSPIIAERLTPNVYLVKNVSFSVFIVGDKGVVVIDTGLPPQGKQILDLIAKVTPKPITTVLFTHSDMDHTGGFPAFPSGLKIIAQENTKKDLEAAIAVKGSDPDTPMLPADHLPNHIVGNREDVTIDGIQMQLIHWGPAHTSGDLIIYLPVEKIVLTGDLIVSDFDNHPLIKMDKGGTSKGWITSVKEMLALNATSYVIAHRCSVVGRDVLEKQLQNAIAERQKVKELYDKGMSLTEIQTAIGDPVPGKIRPSFPVLTPFSEVVYDEIKAGTY